MEGKEISSLLDLCIVFGKDRANGRDTQTAADIISDINREETEANGDGLDDIDADQPLNNPLDAASREESSTQRKRKKAQQLGSFNEQFERVDGNNWSGSGWCMSEAIRVQGSMCSSVDLGIFSSPNYY
ncbi:hypothetical protein L1987_63431 [Smallanthus sonchifolius]|uniref:Uncharacterized protein n=1 Tax=Smallanthus sonchifolius TaxID=185202 RepID=A0ACB9CD96_9ASTR|nr:hypothetical protein L1987_63431 [Smallanthus sonchifolius]